MRRRPRSVTMNATNVNLRSIALPTEHGGWGFTLEPVLLGLLVAPSTAGILIGLTALAAFLAHRPLRLAFGDLWRRRPAARTPAAIAFAAGYGAVAVGCLIAAFVVTETQFWQPLAAAVPLGVVHLAYDARHRTRDLVREVAGPIALGSVASAIARADGWEWGIALGLWVVVAARVVASVPLVREQINMARQRSASSAPVVAAQFIALTACSVAAAVGWSPWLSVVALGVFPIVALAAFTSPPLRATVVGITQLAAGLVVVVLTAIGSPAG